jgi:choline dehydrogenase-like flavoprotein
MFDFIIIGSGVSGARIAHQLTQEGANCLLLEAGKHFKRENFPQSEIDYSAQMFWGGGLELSQDARLGFLRARCVGGTSVVNQALLDRFDEDAFEDWRFHTGIETFTEADWEPYYEEVEKSLSIQTIPIEQQNKNAKIFTKAFKEEGYFWAPLKRAQANCAIEKGSDCITCLGGCPRGSKQSALVTLIPEAEKQGLRIETECDVHSIRVKKNEITVHAFQKGQAKEWKAPKVALAAGSFGNTKILSRSKLKKPLPALGKFFSCHPQYMVYGLFEEPIDAHKGAFQSVQSKDKKLRRFGFKFENVFAPPIGTAMLIPGIGSNHLEAMKKYRYLASMEIALRDEAVGEINVTRSGKIKVKKILTHQDKQRLQEGLATARELFQAVGAKKIIQGEQGFGLHLMGGCAIGVDGKDSVVGPDFQIHENPGLYAADSSIFPSAPGINPSLTIMAMSQKASQEMLS